MQKKEIKAVIDWFLYSGVQNTVNTLDSDGNDLAGSFNAWYDLENNQFSYTYSEITGYALTTFLYLYNITNDNIFLERAIIIGDWLLKKQNINGAFLTAYYHQKNIGPSKPEEFHSFDVGMIANGLANLYRNNKDEKYLIAARKAADWLISFQDKNGSIAAQVGQVDGLIKDNNRTWSTQAGPYHAKLAIGFLNIYDLTLEEKYKQAAEKLCNYALTKQKEDGQFLTYGDLNGTNLHPHAYSAEGLYVAGIFLKNKLYLNAAKRAIEWALLYTKNGIVPRHKHEEVFNYNERVDILSQISRLAILLDISDKKISEILLVIKKHQYFGPNKSQVGGFLFGTMSDGLEAKHVNSWVSMFALQALILEDKKKLGSLFILI